MVLKINDSQLNFNGTIKKFDKDILKYIELANGNVIVLLDIPMDSSEKNNLFCYSPEGDLIWRIEPNEFEKEENDSSMPYETVSHSDRGYMLVDFYGRRFFFFSETGKILGRDFEGRCF